VVAELLHTAGADVFGLDLVADDVLDGVLRDDLGLDEVGRSVLVGGSAVDVLTGGQRDSGVGGEFGLRRDRLVDGRVLIPLEVVLQAVDLGVLTGDDGVALGLLRSGDDAAGGAVVGRVDRDRLRTVALQLTLNPLAGVVGAPAEGLVAAGDGAAAVGHGLLVSAVAERVAGV